MSDLPKSRSSTKSFHILALIFSLSTVSHANTFASLPCRMATICVLSVKTLNVTGSTISPCPSPCPPPPSCASVSPLRAKFSLIKSLSFKAFPVTGFVPCFASHLLMTSTSNIVPSDVQTGCLKGCKLAAQKLKGSLLNDDPLGAFWETFEPALAE